MTINSVADIAGNDAKHAISASTDATARRIWLCALGGVARFGDTNVGAARGVLLPQNVPVSFAASDSDGSDSINLANAYAYVPTGTTLTVAWGS